MARIDLTGLAEFVPEPIMDIKDLIKDAVFKHADMRSYMTVVNDIKYDKRIGFVGELGDVGKKAHSGDCTLNEIAAQATTSQKTWEPKSYDTRLVLCRDYIARQIGYMGLQEGIDSYDITRGDYFRLFEELLKTAIVKMYNRFAWIADSDAAKFGESPPGHITDSKDLDYVNLIDAAWKQVFDIMSTTPAQRVTISENAQSTTAAQYNISKEDALGYIKDLIFKAPLEMRQDMAGGGYYIKTTQHLFDKFAENFQGFELESQRVALENGITAQKFHNVLVFPEPTHDVMIQKWHDDTTKYWRPNRAILYNKNNLLLGIPDSRTWGTFDIFYDKRAKEVVIDMEDKLDVKINHDNLIMAAY